MLLQWCTTHCGSIMSICHSVLRVFFALLYCLCTILIDLSEVKSLTNEGVCVRKYTGPAAGYVEMCRPWRNLPSLRRYGFFQLECCNGYQEIARSVDFLLCQPVCQNMCLKGVCVRPNTCECKKGYFLKSQYECAPLCHPSCRNGDCKGVDDCWCRPGYKMKNGSKSDCEPVCEPSCLNGECYSPGVCKCSEGYKMKSGSSSVCEPICDHPCVNGTCSMPNTCQCFVGFQKVSNNSCSPVCLSGCGPGVCSSPGICECPEGYVMSERSGQCEPTCTSDCVNGHCVAPDECECNEGYELMDGSKTICQPVCTDICENSICVAPEICKCHIGYQQADNNTCKPVCPQGCGLGACVHPGICMCPEGYSAAPDRPCEPLCSIPCIDGFCVAPDVCLCSAGYSLDESGSGKCLLKCDLPCVNSTCVHSNTCECKSGYTKITDTICVPECSPECINGECTAPDTCSCKTGFNVHPEDPSTCLPPLGQLHDSEPTSFLNIFHFPSIVTQLEYNETYYFNRFPKLTLPKPCTLLFQKNISTTSDSQNSTEELLSCQLHEFSSELHMKFLCKWPLLEDDSDNNSYIFNTSFYNVSSTNSTHRNLSLYLLFPEDYSESSVGFCNVCMRPPKNSRYFRIDEDILLAVDSCLDDRNDKLKLFTEGEETLISWLSVTLTACGIFIFGMIGVGTLLYFVLRSRTPTGTHYIRDEDSSL